MIEQVLQIFCKIITRYLTECSNKDRLVLIALEHFIHLVLFGDELCLEAIQLGGQEVVLSHLASSSIPSSIEAAGVLTQLTNPQRTFIQLQNLESVLIRLLDLVDTCNTGETLLLLSAALANASLQDPCAIDLLYRRNAIARLINAYSRHDCSTIFVQEQIVTILCRLAARRYEEALISQGAVPVLLEMLTVTDGNHSDYCKRIRYKAAVCIGTLAATGIGLQSLYVNKGFAILTYVLEMEKSPANPLNMICTNIRNRLEMKYQIESAV
uniref:Insc_C domain-containing protein n=1 Tax=Angiostrongylus cantonensis TaxID=6313 RepID=A0A158P7E7_ANGCA